MSPSCHSPIVRSWLQLMGRYANFQACLTLTTLLNLCDFYGVLMYPMLWRMLSPDCMQSLVTRIVGLDFLKVFCVEYASSDCFRGLQLSFQPYSITTRLGKQPAVKRVSHLLNSRICMNFIGGRARANVKRPCAVETDHVVAQGYSQSSYSYTNIVNNRLSRKCVRRILFTRASTVSFKSTARQYFAGIDVVHV
jgi:hypothetical protein